jgi:hypothetical protein
VLERHRHHSLFGVEPEREVSGASRAQPEMFTPRDLLPRAIQSRIEIMGRSFCEEEFAFT